MAIPSSIGANFDTPWGIVLLWDKRFSEFDLCNSVIAQTEAEAGQIYIRKIRRRNNRYWKDPEYFEWVIRGFAV